MSQSHRPVRLHDVAREAGVHVSTASRVLNDAHDASVRPETRARIVAAARRLRYQPNALARGLRIQTAGAIGFLIPTLRNPANAPIARSAFARAWSRGFVVLVVEDSDGDSDAAREAYERLVEQRRIDGLLIQSARIGVPFFDRFEDGHIPCVFVDRGHASPGRNVTLREEDAGRLAADYLAGLGHAQFGHIAGPGDLDTTRRRSQAFEDRSRERGLATTRVEAALDERSGRDAFRAVIAEQPGVTAVYVANINQAIGSLVAAREAGLRVPADVSILSHDDDPLAEFLEVPLSAIDMPLTELGALAVDALIDQIEGGSARDVVVPTPPRIVERSSTGPPSPRLLHRRH